MKYPKLRELKEAIRALIKGPYTSRFPYQPHQPFERFRGKSEFHQDDCVGCGACVQVCPARAIEMKDERGKRTLTVRWDLCIFCGQCQINCLTGNGIMLSWEFDLATTGKRADLYQSIEKRLVLCECCGEVIAPYDQILWVVKRLGPLAFGNASLVLFYLRDFPKEGLLQPISSSADKEAVVREEPSLKEEEFLRADRIKILCPRCRREAVIKS